MASPLIGQLSGETVEALLATLPTDHREAAVRIVAHLYGERVLVDGSAADAHVAKKHRIKLAGSGRLRDRLEANEVGVSKLTVLCQDRLDYEEAVQINRRCRQEKSSLLWVSHGALTRAYVSPLFLPDAGPCFECLLRSFQRLSPAPEIYDSLREHVRRNKPLEPVDFPEEGLLIIKGLVRWKLDQAERDQPDPAVSIGFTFWNAEH